MPKEKRRTDMSDAADLAVLRQELNRLSSTTQSSAQSLHIANKLLFLTLGFIIGVAVVKCTEQPASRTEDDPLFQSL